MRGIQKSCNIAGSRGQAAGRRHFKKSSIKNCGIESYERHGTQCLIGNFEVATGRIISPTIGDTRTEQDFASHIEQTIVVFDKPSSALSGTFSRREKETHP